MELFLTFLAQYGGGGSSTGGGGNGATVAYWIVVVIAAIAAVSLAVWLFRRVSTKRHSTTSS